MGNFSHLSWNSSLLCGLDCRHPTFIGLLAPPAQRKKQAYCAFRKTHTHTHTHTLRVSCSEKKKKNARVPFLQGPQPALRQHAGGRADPAMAHGGQDLREAKGPLNGGGSVRFLSVACYCGWMKSIAHRFESMQNQCLLVFTGTSSYQGF